MNIEHAIDVRICACSRKSTITCACGLGHCSTECISHVCDPKLRTDIAYYHIAVAELRASYAFKDIIAKFSDLLGDVYVIIDPMEEWPDHLVYGVPGIRDAGKDFKITQHVTLHIGPAGPHEITQITYLHSRGDALYKIAVAAPDPYGRRFPARFAEVIPMMVSPQGIYWGRKPPTRVKS